MKDYNMDDLMKFRDELLKSLNTEQIVLFDALMEAVVKNVQTIQKMAKEQKEAADALVENAIKQMNEAQGELDEIKRTLDSFGIKW